MEFTTEQVKEMTTTQAEQIGVKLFTKVDSFQAFQMHTNKLRSDAIMTNRPDLNSALKHGWAIAKAANVTYFGGGTFVADKANDELARIAQGIAPCEKLAAKYDRDVRRASKLNKGFIELFGASA